MSPFHIEFCEIGRTRLTLFFLSPRLQLLPQVTEQIHLGVRVPDWVGDDRLQFADQMTQRIGEELRRPTAERLRQFDHETIEIGASQEV